MRERNILTVAIYGYFSGTDFIGIETQLHNLNWLTAQKAFHAPLTVFLVSLFLRKGNLVGVEYDFCEFGNGACCTRGACIRADHLT